MPKWMVLLILITVIVVVLAVLVWAVPSFFPQKSASSKFGSLAPPAQNQVLPNVSDITATPMPRPTGPGPYACDPLGICNHYGDTQRKENCEVTYADEHCLDSCSEPSVRCLK